jgi:uncharacterized caspase-like protein
MRTGFRLFVLAVVWALSTGALAQTGERVALVIGNAAYPRAPLENPGHDARAMTELLTKAGFRVDQHLDASQADLARAIEQFGKAIRDPKVKFGLFYYAGHGLQQNWRNYLVPVTARIHSAEDVPRQTVDVSELLAYMGQAKGRSFLVILDACRDDPFNGDYRPDAKGLSQFDAPPGSMLAYATAPGSVALDGTGANGLYTSSLLQEFAVQGAKIEDAFKRVRLNVRLASRGQQVPWETTSLEEDIYLFPNERRKLSEAERESLLDQEMQAWTMLKGSLDVDSLASFLRRYPSGYASELAQHRLIRLLAQQEQAIAEAAARKKQQEQQLALAAETAARERADAEQRKAAAAVAQANAQAQAQAEKRQAREAQALEEEKRRRENAEEARAAREKAEREQQFAREQASTQPVHMPTAIAATPFSQGYALHERRYNVGDKFAFNVIDGLTHIAKPLEMTVTAVDPQQERVEFNRGVFVADLMGNIVTNDRGVFSTPRQFYPAELYVGKKWKTMFKQKRPNGTTYTFEYDVRVTGRETITVPAGTFDTFKIEARGFNLQLGASLSRNIWVAPGVAADIAHEIVVRLRNSTIDQFDRQELVAIGKAGTSGR